ncbi:zinc-binding dehydrogenase [Jatrophihabitans sp. GAS493]|uniref:zinc-binding dehydrogenase n=1 Tax=Jatrophihabitans sp. GAS493 TaxID=1907575 RepID=UPI001560C00D|nr:zinc-binding dehydrogenase [Jatrophihabitans sp. GAS493]
MTTSREVTNWKVGIATSGRLTRLAVRPSDADSVALTGEQVRIAVHATGLNFRDVLTAVGHYRGASLALGHEVAGVVSEVAAAVQTPAVGDRVCAVATDGIAPYVVTDRRATAAIPADWTYEQAAAVPIAYLTAIYALRDIARVGAGDRVLIHAVAGGVGLAALQVAIWLRAQVFGTASPSKWGALREYGLGSDRLSSSRTLDFESDIRAKSGGGVDVVLNSLAGPFVEASLRLVKPRGTFLELGLDMDAKASARFPDVGYRRVHLDDVAPRRRQTILREAVRLIEAGAVKLPPVSVWDVDCAVCAFEHMARARHVGKIVLSLDGQLRCRDSRNGVSAV